LLKLAKKLVSLETQDHQQGHALLSEPPKQKQSARLY